MSWWKVAQLKTNFWDFRGIMDVGLEIFRIDSCKNINLENLVQKCNPRLNRQVIVKTTIDLEQRRHVKLSFFLRQARQINVKICKRKQVLWPDVVQMGSLYFEQFDQLIVLFEKLCHLLNTFQSSRVLPWIRRRLVAYKCNNLEQLRPVIFN